MRRIAVLGANGQVGAEVCLLLAQHPEVQVIPICRNPTGSAFLRYHGIPCRHGLPTEPDQAARLLGDCEVVVNFARSVARPREALGINRRIIENAARFSLPRARILYFSTLQVYRRFRPLGAPPWRTAYGVEKLRCERMSRRAARRHGKDSYILRLGHVLGELQNMTQDLRRLIRAGSVIVPREGRHPSGTVHTVSVADAILKIGAGEERPGTYDLLSTPSMSWRQVLELEAAAIGRKLVIEPPTADPLNDGDSPRAADRIKSRVRGAFAGIAARPLARELGLRLLEHMPETWNARAQAAHFRRRAALEIALFTTRTCSYDAFTYLPAGGRFLHSLARTLDLLQQQSPALLLASGSRDRFPPDPLHHDPDSSRR